MTTGKTTKIKRLLRDECLPALAKGSAYFSLADVRAWLRGQRVVCPPPLLRGYRRIQMATLLKYAGDRKLQPTALFGDKNQLTPPFERRRR